jgi:hypothetical protein
MKYPFLFLVPLHSQFPHLIKLYCTLLKTEILQNILVHLYTIVIVMTSVLFAYNAEDQGKILNLMLSKLRFKPVILHDIFMILCIMGQISQYIG